MVVNIYRRFSEHLTDENQWINEQSHESYVKNYSIVYKNDEFMAGRGMLKDVLFDVSIIFILP